ncbi:cell wall-binding repeat-containing protein [Desulfosporosinus sp. PR]|uniref:cell wall-binding repeat-containing protein n=1 Tax=Candidatus Desulfosporosinus nitrosoreducens TaxID=3401928 RepID=UPI0027F77DAD|nr:cell wall-binding repeat-containing protein [Desulfosporosinus sp. PR]MDQ7092379.1 cell wall-binding repeat-containing protein [Desulfosporosinus sp. PR]
MKKTKKALASLAIAGMTLSAIPYNAFAATTVPTRLAGTTAEQTAVAIADQTGWTGAAVLASSTSYGMVDALTAGPLATYLKAPILLQGAGNTLNADTKTELQKLNVKTVYVTSGTAVISQSVLDQLSGMGITVVSLGGNDRFETSANIAKKMVELGAPVTKVAVAYGWLNQDALSIASVASASTEPILLTDKNSVPSSVQAFLSANNISSSDVIGGTGVISDAVKAQFPNATRHFGNTAYDTNNQVIQDFSSSLGFDNVYVANGETAIDALAGAPLAAQTKSAIVLTNGTVPAAATFVHSKLGANGVVTALGGTAVVSDAVRTGIVNGTVPTQGDLAVTSVTATSANSFKVVFNQAPADTSKVTFNVTNSTTPVTVTATWNADNTEATLANSANFPEGTYNVSVKNDSTDLGTSSVTVAQQKIASINITSDKLGVVTDSNNNNSQTGYATYNVLDQYGNDITTSSLANSLAFQSGVGTVDAKDGLLTLTPSSNSTNLMQYPTVVITGYDSTSGVSVSATLTTSTQIGTLSDFQLGTLSNADGKVLTAGDSSEFYASFTATDMSGNPTTNYDLIKGGLILHSDSNGNDNLLTTSNSYVTASLEKDPSDSTKAVVKVVATGDSNALTMDMPTVITAMTWSGKTSTLNTTLHKASQIDSFTLMAPAETIAVNEGKAIPFTALDQNGQPLTKYSDLKGTNLTISNAELVENTDGTASLLAGTDGNGFATDGQQVITATTSTGKYSSITLNIQKYAKVDTLSLDSSVLLNNMQSNASQGVDFGYNYGGFTVKDQYGRVFDMVGKASGAAVGNAPAYNYEVLATASGALTVEGSDKNKNVIENGDPVAYGANGIQVTAKDGYQTTGGTGTVTFQLVNTLDGHDGTAADPHTVIDSKSVTVQVLKNDDIKGYTMDTVANPIYADATSDTTPGAFSGRVDAFAANPSVYGTTASGSKVMLAGTPIIGASIDSSDFGIEYANNAAISLSNPTTYDGVNVYAKTLADSVTTSSTTLGVTIMGADQKVHSLTTPIKSTKDTPAAASLNVSVSTFNAGITLNDAGDIAHVNASDLAAGKIMARFDQSGNVPSAGRAGVYFYSKDQYGTKAAPLAQIILVSDVGGNGSFGIDQDGTIKAGSTVVSGEKITVSAITPNGLVKTIQIIVD